MIFFQQLIPDENELPNIEYIKVQGEITKFDSSEWEEYKEWNKNDHQKFFQSFIRTTAINFAEILIKKRWSIIFCEQPSFITSDKPVIVQHPTRDKFGLTTKGVIVSFPLSPTRIMVMDDLDSKPDGLYYRLKKNNLGAINLATWRNSMKYMISSRNIDNVLLEIVDYADGQDLKEVCRPIHNILKLLSYVFKNRYKKAS
ncbi:MAG: DUF4238 domain-containing protein [Cyanobacteria bacterium P01_A01_bin.40]